MIDFKNASSGSDGRYNGYFNIAGQILILAKIDQGSKHILLEDLYTTLGAKTESTKNGIQWSVREAKNSGLISKIKGLQGVYKVVNPQPKPLVQCDS